MELVRCKSRPCGRKRKVAVPRTRNENGGSDQVPADGGGKRGAGLRKRKDSTEGAVVVVNAHPPRTPHDQMERINRPFAGDQLDVSIESLAKNVVFFPLYYKQADGSDLLRDG
jgi:hypothetical protein